MPKKYRVVDLYENTGILGDADTLEDAQTIAGQWEYETDGECDVVIMQWDDTYQAYVAMKRKRKEDASA
ncbi:MAG: hypothetical protein IJ644_10010 [Oscillospiraceae bacterium]|nr:hypothetical protein [Oscillospiraceae bacterium]